MRRRLMMFAAGAVAVAAACSQFSSTPDAPAAGDASAESSSPEDAGADAPAPPPPPPPLGTSTTFFCPLPAGSCTFLDEVCCFGGAGGYCTEAGASCSGNSAALCDSPGACKALYGASTAACCDVNGIFSCARDGCGTVGVEICRPTKMPPECADASATCALSSDGYGICN